VTKPWHGSRSTGRRTGPSATAVPRTSRFRRRPSSANADRSTFCWAAVKAVHELRARDLRLDELVDRDRDQRGADGRDDRRAGHGGATMRRRPGRRRARLDERRLAEGVGPTPTRVA
jgi:hypothetical protein